MISVFLMRLRRIEKNTLASFCVAAVRCAIPLNDEHMRQRTGACVHENGLLSEKHQFTNCGGLVDGLEDASQHVSLLGFNDQLTFATDGVEPRLHFYGAAGKIFFLPPLPMNAAPMA